MSHLQPSLRSISSEESLLESTKAKRRKDMFGDCALVEIIHLHDCLRGALKALQQDVFQLSQSVQTGSGDSTDLERRVAGRFKVIWSVFRAHSAAEDEFIWPALKSKTGRHLGSPKYNPAEEAEAASDQQEDEGSANSSADQPSVVEEDEYAEDHADEERMFKTMDELLVKLRDDMITSNSKNNTTSSQKRIEIHDTAQEIHQKTSSLMTHLMTHLEKEETQCMPLVVKHLNKEEINDLVGQIMGKRSSETIAEIMSMAIENLEDTEREEMVRYMKQAMVGTFFEKWLAMSGWMTETTPEKAEEDKKKSAVADEEPAVVKHVIEDTVEDGVDDTEPLTKKLKTEYCQEVACDNAMNHTTSQGELERLIRAIASNPALSPVQKNTTIQGLRDSVWKSNMRHSAAAAAVAGAQIPFVPQIIGGMPFAATPLAAPSTTRSKRETPPSAYYKKDKDGKNILLWSRETAQSSNYLPGNPAVPLFSASELAPTYHDGANGAVLGCPHYARACKLRHPSSGRLYTCRLCCEQEREHPLKDQDSPLDRYSVTEVYCMRCSTLQPANDRCITPGCGSTAQAKCNASFGKYNCKLCNLYDDRPNKDIFHCPFCNVCKIGQGLGIDFRHCMRCNACVSLADDDHHCIPQRLQGSCPICHESMFESTEPLRGLHCGHVLHLSCFGMYMRGGAYTCPLCKKSVEDMKEYFSMLDAAVRMQPMPASYQSTFSNIYCQDCNKTGQVQYHFVGCKCEKCGSYNTRELGRVQNYSQASP